MKKGVQDKDEDKDKEERQRKFIQRQKRKYYPDSKKFSEGKKKIEIEYVGNTDKRQTTFSKRRDGLMKKGYELHRMTGCQVLICVCSETAHFYTFASPQMTPFVKGLKVESDLVKLSKTV